MLFRSDGTPDSLSQSMSTDHKLLIRVAGPQEEIKKLLQKIPGMLEVSLVGQRETGEVYDFSLEAEKGLDIRREVFKRLAERSWPLLGMRSSELSLEDIFLQLTAEDSAASETENGGNA